VLCHGKIYWSGVSQIVGTAGQASRGTLILGCDKALGAR